MKRLAAMASAFALAGAALQGIAAEPSQHYIVNAAELNWKDAVALPRGAKVAVLEGDLSKPVPFTFRVKYPPNFDVPPHWHPAIEHVTVLQGIFYVGEGDTLDKSQTRYVPPGSFYYMAPNHNHFGWIGNEETIIQLHGVGPWGITYVNPADDPRNKK